jgi:glutamyl-tRNA synthetase
VLVNLKQRTFLQFVSQGMVLCCLNADGTKAGLLKPPEGSQIGDKVYFEGKERDPPQTLTGRKTPWDRVHPAL